MVNVHATPESKPHPITNFSTASYNKWYNFNSKASSDRICCQYMKNVSDVKKVIYSALVKFSLRSLMSHNHLSLDLHGRVNPAFSSPSPFLPYFSKLFDPKDLWALGRIPIKVLVTFCDPYIKFTLIASTNKLLKKKGYTWQNG